MDRGVQEDNPTGGWDKFKTMYLAGGTKMEVVGSNLQQIDFKAVQGAGETRIAAAAGVPPVIVGLSEGLQAATYSNYGQARRRFADNTMRPLWRNFAGSLETIVPPPPGSRLWYDDRDIQALAEDKKDLAEVRSSRPADPDARRRRV
jgi:phage portal protein BeeE